MFNILSKNEHELCQKAIQDLNEQPWAEGLIKKIREGGGVNYENADFLFELRFAYALHKVGISAEYEVAGEGDSQIDFKFAWNNKTWLVELLRLGETDAAKAATQTLTDEDGIQITTRLFRTPNENIDGEKPHNESTEGETIKAIQRICQKCERKGKPYKFPMPAEDTIHLLLVDMRNFLNGGDHPDRLHIALGAWAVSEPCRLAWKGKPITGVFCPDTNLHGAHEARTRLHFLGFVRERTFEVDEFANVIDLIANPNLFANVEAVKDSGATWPLQPARILNVK